MKSATDLKKSLQPLFERWEALEQREQNLLLLAATTIVLALLWWVALAPALTTLKTAPARMAAADKELQSMLQMRAQADMLRQQPQGNAFEARKQLEQSIKSDLAASAQSQWLGNRLQITLSNAPAPALARWLSQVRDNSRASVAEMKLNRQSSDTAGAALASTPDASAITHWSGTLLLDMPGEAEQGN